MENNILENIHILKQMHEDGLLGGEVMPEDVLINVVKEDELLDVLTLAMALNYQRNSYSLWESVVKAYKILKRAGYLIQLLSPPKISMSFVKHCYYIVWAYSQTAILIFGNVLQKV